MRFYHGRYIFPGLLAFMALITFPMWYGAAGSKPPFQNPVSNTAGEKCIESKDYMRANHMRLLIAWRDSVVRNGERTYIASDGRLWNKSLTPTCMACHGQANTAGESTSPATYCEHCHRYVGVRTPIYCWDCHIDPVAVNKGAK